MSYLDGLLKAMEMVASYGTSAVTPEPNTTIRAILAALEAEVVRYQRHQRTITWEHV